MAETLLEYLRRPNPKILHATPLGTRKKSKSVSKNPLYTYPRWIKKWEGVEWDTLRCKYEAALGISKERGHIELSHRDRTIKDEDGFSDIVFLWNKEIISKALVDFQEHMGHDQPMVMVRGNKAGKCPGPTRALKPDWASIVQSGAQVESDAAILEHSILPGDSKYSKNWTSSEIENGRCLYNSPNEFPRWLWPLAQIFTYCYRLEKRYGYLITDEELVLVRIGPKKDKPPPPGPRDPKRLVIEESGKDGLLEWVSVPWCNGRTADGHEVEDGNGMSVNTALWCLHLLAFADNSIKWTYESLAETDVTEEYLSSFTSPQIDGNSDRALGSFRVGSDEENGFFVPELVAAKRNARPKKRGRPRKRGVSKIQKR
ncbi:hypothetical protein DM02DRAFT_729598 [Periconia macrospinosa]|uniref:Uncharacterized protein n=1 Tax=Periconia macrospinosa TaxID=97972 RepID=A0A2V1DMM3_9PLEO|nr:hypothetical protein DM02DRAFT_729598 [Periconia macrospinosa]